MNYLNHMEGCVSYSVHDNNEITRPSILLNQRGITPKDHLNAQSQLINLLPPAPRNPKVVT